jgi:hypothetical protein
LRPESRLDHERQKGTTAMSGIAFGRGDPYRTAAQDPLADLQRETRTQKRVIGGLLVISGLLTLGWMTTIIRHERTVGTRAEDNYVRGAPIYIITVEGEYRRRASGKAGSQLFTWHGLECFAYCDHYGRGLPNCEVYTWAYCYLPPQPICR